MNPSDDELRHFMLRWEEDLGEILPPEVARAEARRLIHFFETLEHLVMSSTKAEPAPNAHEVLPLLPKVD
jgi:hypothetical protein